MPGGSRNDTRDGMHARLRHAVMAEIRNSRPSRGTPYSLFGLGVTGYSFGTRCTTPSEQAPFEPFGRPAVSDHTVWAVRVPPTLRHLTSTQRAGSNSRNHVGGPGSLANREKLALVATLPLTSPLSGAHLSHKTRINARISSNLGGDTQSADCLQERSQFELSGDLRIGVFLGRTLKIFQREALHRLLARPSFKGLKDWMCAPNRAMCGCHPLGAGDYEETHLNPEFGRKPRRAVGRTQTAEA
jgi:hypothetical protein